jgi:hypothetical protein
MKTTIYDKNGNLANKDAFKVGEELSDATTKLYKRLLKKGMTIVEGRALSDYLKGQVDVSAIMQLMIAQCQL